MQDVGGKLQCPGTQSSDEMRVQRETAAQPWEGESYKHCCSAVLFTNLQRKQIYWHNDRATSCDARASCRHRISNITPIKLYIHTGMQSMSARCCGRHARAARSQRQSREQACLLSTLSIIGSWKGRSSSPSSVQVLGPMRRSLSQHASHRMHVAVEEEWRER